MKVWFEYYDEQQVLWAEADEAVGKPGGAGDRAVDVPAKLFREWQRKAAEFAKVDGRLREAIAAEVEARRVVDQGSYWKMVDDARSRHEEVQLGPPEPPEGGYLTWETIYESERRQKER